MELSAKGEVLAILLSECLLEWESNRGVVVELTLLLLAWKLLIPARLELEVDPEEYCWKNFFDISLLS